MPRKCFILVTKVCKKVFFYKFINDWKFTEVYGVTKLEINENGRGNYRGNLDDKEAFRQLKKGSYIINITSD